VTMRSPIKELEAVDWNFADYSSSQFPTDINSLHWYPAAFVPQIPAILIKTLSRPGDVVFDPFSGSGTTIVEASRLRRSFIGVDHNPYAVNICKAKFTAIGDTEESWFAEELKIVQSLHVIEDARHYCALTGIEDEVFKWFHDKSLGEILALHQHILRNRGSHANLLRQVILSSILNRCCSQRDHYTYITDRCFPKELLYRPARVMYCEQIKLTCRAVMETRRQYARVYDSEWKPSRDGVVECRDARSLSWLSDGAVDLVVTSPPYLGVNDYVRSMRLTALLFPEEGVERAIASEIGARRKRFHSKAFEDYKNDMNQVFAEIARILKRAGYLGLVIGQGRGRVNKGDTLDLLVSMLREEFQFSVQFEEERRIKFRRIQVPGVGTERIIVFRR